MNRQIAVAAAAGLIVGAALCLRWTEDAPAQQPPAPEQWEFQVIDFQLGRSASSAARLANLYQDGWEYVGMLSTGSSDNGLFIGSVAFKRRTDDDGRVEAGAVEGARSP